MENRGHSCQGDLAADESHSHFGSELEACVAQEINNTELANKDSESDVDCTEPTEDIAETKKRRARVHSNAHLFIPKELARSQLNRRSYCSSVNTLDGISRNSDYCIRMLKFPVGSGRARYVAEQMKRRKSRKSQKLQLEEEKEATNDMGCIKSELNAQSLLECNAATEQFDEILASSRSSVETENPHLNRLENGNDCFIALEDTTDETENEEDGTEELIERLSKRQLKRDARLQLKLKDNKQQEQLHYQCFRWHNPSCNDKETKMSALKDLERIGSSANFEVQEDFNDVVATADNEEHQQQPQQVTELLELSDESVNKLPEFLPDVRVTTQREKQLQLQEHISNELSDKPEHKLDKFLPDIRVATQHQEDEQQQQHNKSIQAVSIPRSEHLQQQQQLITDVPPTTINNYRTFEAQPADLTMRRLCLQPIDTRDMLQLHSANTNAGNNVLNEHLQQPFVEPSDLMQPWRMQQYERLVYRPPAPQQQLSLAIQQQQQVLMREQQLQSIYQEHQWDECREELQNLNAQYKTLKYKEAEQLQGLSKSLSELYDNRLIRKRRHDEYHRTFLQKMEESKKQEECLHVQKHKLKLQIQADLSSLHQRITNKNRELQERAWQCQRQQQLLHQQHQQQELAYRQHQQHQHQQQLHQHFLRHLQPPRRPPLMQPPPIPPQSVYHPHCIETPVAQSFDECIMRRQRFIDPTHQPFQQSRANVAINPSRGYYDHLTVRSDIPHFTLPELPIASGTTQVNRAIEQTAITSIISNYVTNFLNDTETTHR
ncbi:GH17063 [Drosophila grimshawi]|uniref:GH17063 n=1 Tax=Drosophila grimshawi TaxID=7222 RepID=B4IZL6_DROGR|nr:GH17063 [Drosophila grimshawi]